MNDIIKIPALFLLVFFILCIILVFFNVLSLIITTYGNLSEISFSHFISLVPTALLTILPGTTILCLITILIKISLKPTNHLIVIVILILLNYAIITGLLIGLSGIITVNPQNQNASHFVMEKKINNYGSLILFPETITHNVLENTIIVNPEAEDNKFSYYDKVNHKSSGNSITFFLHDNEYPIEVINPYQRYLTEFDPFTTIIIKILNFFSYSITNQAQNPHLRYFLTCFAIIFFIAASSIFTQITKWPMFNILLFISIITVVMILYNQYQSVIYVELVKIIETNFLLDYIPEIGLITISILFLLIKIIFIPHPKKEKGTQVD